MNIEHMVAQRFRHLMSCSWEDFPKSMNMFENHIYKLRRTMEAGEPFTNLSWSYSPHAVAEHGYRIHQYCRDDVSEGAIERMVVEELIKRGLEHNTILENAEPTAITAGTYRICGVLSPMVLEQELLPSDEFLGHPIYSHKGKIFTIESVQTEDAPVNNVGGGNIAGVSPGQEPPGKRGLYFMRNLKKTRQLNKKIKRKL